MRTKFLFSTIATLLFVSSSLAQGMKIGYADANLILNLHPDAKAVNSELESHQTMLTTRLEAKYKDYQTRLQDYQQNGATMDDVLRKNMEEELVQMQESIRQLEQEGQNSLIKKQTDLLQPVFDKIRTAIDSVAKEIGYDFILSAGTQGIDVILFAKEEHNVTNMVLKKLGIDPPAENK